MLLALAVSLNSCEEENDTHIILEETSKTLFSGEEYAIKASSDYKITYKSSDDFVASVSVTGKVAAYNVGEAVVTLSNGTEEKEFKVFVAPKYDLYPDPILDFGMSKTNLVKKLGTPKVEKVMDEYEYIAYEGKSDNVSNIVYFFVDNLFVQVTLEMLDEKTKDLMPFLHERYMFLSTIDDPEYGGAMEYFVDSNDYEKTTKWIVNWMPTSEYRCISYMEYDYKPLKMGTKRYTRPFDVYR